MKIPPTPPDWQHLLTRNSRNLMNILQKNASPLVGRKYRHWDTLRFMEPPEGLSLDQWWLTIKMARYPQYRKMAPFKDKENRPFIYLLTDQVLAELHAIDSKASGRVAMPEAVTSDETRDRYIFNSLIEEAITSSQLEGASTTRQVAAEMLRSGRRPRTKHEQMILNNYRAMRTIQALSQKRLTVATVLDLHRQLTEDTLENPEAAGRLQRVGEERVNVVHNASQDILHVPPPAEQLEARLAALVEFANATAGTGPDREFVHPVIRAITLHFMLAYDHPFIDGNGRVARALFYWSMLRQGYWLFEFVSISRILKKAPTQYGRAFLYTETDENDLTYFFEYQLGVIRRALAELEGYLDEKQQEVQRIEGRLRKTDLNYRQLALLGHAIRHPGHRYTIRSHRVSHNVAYGTARHDLLDLASRNLLDCRREGQKTLVFTAPMDLEGRLESEAAGHEQNASSG